MAVPDSFFCRVCGPVPESAASGAPAPEPEAEPERKGLKREREDDHAVDAASLMSSFGAN